MKLLFTLSILFVTALCFGQNPFPVDPATQKILYQDVVKTDSVAAPELHKRAKDWLFQVIKSPKSAIEIDDNSTLSVQITYDYANNPGSALSKRARVYIPLQLEFKDGRYRYTITNLKYGAQQMPTMQIPLEKLASDNLGKSDQRSAEGIDNAIRRQVIESLKTAMASKGKDW